MGAHLNRFTAFQKGGDYSWECSFFMDTVLVPVSRVIDFFFFLYLQGEGHFCHNHP